ncbi:MAG: AEC family transporter [Solirubrobacteraceae bacterium]
MSLPLLVVAMLVATAVGVGAEHRWRGTAERLSRRTMELMLAWVLPPVYFVLVSRLDVDTALLGGIGTAYLALAVVGVLAWWIAARVLRLPRRTVGAVLLAVVLANTGYFGLPLVRTVLGPDELGPAVAWDSLVSGPMFFAVAFAIGAAFGVDADGDERRGARLRAFLRNPLLWTAIVALVVPWDASDGLADVATGVVVALLPIGFFVVGVQLAGEVEDDPSRDTGAGRAMDRLGLGWSPALGLVIGLRLVVAPLVAVGVSVAALDLPAGMLLQAAMPTGINSLLVAHRFGLDLRPIAGAIAWTTVIMTVGVIGVSVAG